MAGTKKIRSGDIAVEGLRELSRDLKQLGPEFQKQLRVVNKEAAEIVATEARSRALSLGGSAAKGARTIRATGGVKSAAVGFGGASAPWMGGSEFGANRDSQRHRSTGTYVGYRQFDIWRGSDSHAGYFFYPSLRSEMDRVVEHYAAALNRLLGPDTP